MSTIKHGLTMPAGVEVLGPLAEGYDEILSPDALAFLAELERRFGPTRHELLARRREVDARLQAGELPDFLEETREVREADWQIAPVPRDLRDRRVEITGPVDRKMIVNALNCGASVYMADFEDATTPTWANLIEGQINLRDAIRRKIDFTDPDSRKRYRLGDKIATLLVRPRGWHLPEAHLAIDGQPMSGALFDFGLYVFHNAKELIARGTGPYFYLPKLESHLEARLWNDVFLFAQERLGMPEGHDQGDRADRDHPRGVRDGRDPVRAARALGRAQLRPLGLHLQHHQEVPQPARVRHARPRPGDHDRALHALVQPARDPDLPSPRRARDRRHGRADPDPRRSRRPTSRRSARCARTRSARQQTATTAPGSRTRVWYRSPRRCSTS